MMKRYVQVLLIRTVQKKAVLVLGSKSSDQVGGRRFAPPGARVEHINNVFANSILTSGYKVKNTYYS